MSKVHLPDMSKDDLVVLVKRLNGQIKFLQQHSGAPTGVTVGPNGAIIPSNGPSSASSEEHTATIKQLKQENAELNMRLRSSQEQITLMREELVSKTEEVSALSRQLSLLSDQLVESQSTVDQLLKEQQQLQEEMALRAQIQSANNSVQQSPSSLSPASAGGMLHGHGGMATLSPTPSSSNLKAAAGKAGGMGMVSPPPLVGGVSASAVALANKAGGAMAGGGGASMSVAAQAEKTIVTLQMRISELEETLDFYATIVQAQDNTNTTTTTPSGGNGKSGTAPPLLQSLVDPFDCPSPAPHHHGSGEANEKNISASAVKAYREKGQKDFAVIVNTQITNYKRIVQQLYEECAVVRGERDDLRLQNMKLKKRSELLDGLAWFSARPLSITTGAHHHQLNGGGGVGSSPQSHPNGSGSSAVNSNHPSAGAPHADGEERSILTTGTNELSPTNARNAAIDRVSSTAIDGTARVAAGGGGGAAVSPTSSFGGEGHGTAATIIHEGNFGRLGSASNSTRASVGPQQRPLQFSDGPASPQQQTTFFQSLFGALPNLKYGGGGSAATSSSPGAAGSSMVSSALLSSNPLTNTLLGRGRAGSVLSANEEPMGSDGLPTHFPKLNLGTLPDKALKGTITAREQKLLDRTNAVEAYVEQLLEFNESRQRNYDELDHNRAELFASLNEKLQSQKDEIIKLSKEVKSLATVNKLLNTARSGGGASTVAGGAAAIVPASAASDGSPPSLTRQHTMEDPANVARSHEDHHDNADGAMASHNNRSSKPVVETASVSCQADSFVPLQQQADVQTTALVTADANEQTDTCSAKDEEESSSATPTATVDPTAASMQSNNMISLEEHEALLKAAEKRGQMEGVNLTKSAAKAAVGSQRLQFESAQVRQDGYCEWMEGIVAEMRFLLIGSMNESSALRTAIEVAEQQLSAAKAQFETEFAELQQSHQQQREHDDAQRSLIVAATQREEMTAAAAAAAAAEHSANNAAASVEQLERALADLDSTQKQLADALESLNEHRDALDSEKALRMSVEEEVARLTAERAALGAQHTQLLAEKAAGEQQSRETLVSLTAALAAAREQQSQQEEQLRAALAARDEAVAAAAPSVVVNADREDDDTSAVPQQEQQHPAAPFDALRMASVTADASKLLARLSDLSSVSTVADGEGSTSMRDSSSERIATIRQLKASLLCAIGGEKESNGDGKGGDAEQPSTWDIPPHPLPIESREQQPEDDSDDAANRSDNFSSFKPLEEDDGDFGVAVSGGGQPESAGHHEDTCTPTAICDEAPREDCHNADDDDDDDRIAPAGADSVVVSAQRSPLDTSIEHHNHSYQQADDTCGALDGGRVESGEVTPTQQHIHHPHPMAASAGDVDHHNAVADADIDIDDVLSVSPLTRADTLDCAVSHHHCEEGEGDAFVREDAAVAVLNGHQQDVVVPALVVEEVGADEDIVVEGFGRPAEQHQQEDVASEFPPLDSEDEIGDGHILQLTSGGKAVEAEGDVLGPQSPPSEEDAEAEEQQHGIADSNVNTTTMLVVDSSEKVTLSDIDALDTAVVVLGQSNSAAHDDAVEEDAAAGAVDTPFDAVGEDPSFVAPATAAASTTDNGFAIGSTSSAIPGTFDSFPMVTVDDDQSLSQPPPPLAPPPPPQQQAPALLLATGDYTHQYSSNANGASPHTPASATMMSSSTINNRSHVSVDLEGNRMYEYDPSSSAAAAVAAVGASDAPQAGATISTMPVASTAETQQHEHNNFHNSDALNGGGFPSPQFPLGSTTDLGAAVPTGSPAVPPVTNATAPATFYSSGVAVPSVSHDNDFFGTGGHAGVSASPHPATDQQQQPFTVVDDDDDFGDFAHSTAPPPPPIAAALSLSSKPPSSYSIPKGAYSTGAAAATPSPQQPHTEQQFTSPLAPPQQQPSASVAVPTTTAAYYAPSSAFPMSYEPPTDLYVSPQYAAYQNAGASAASGYSSPMVSSGGGGAVVAVASPPPLAQQQAPQEDDWFGAAMSGQPMPPPPPTHQPPPTNTPSAASYFDPFA